MFKQLLCLREWNPDNHLPEWCCKSASALQLVQWLLNSQTPPTPIWLEGSSYGQSKISEQILSCTANAHGGMSWYQNTPYVCCVYGGLKMHDRLRDFGRDEQEFSTVHSLLPSVTPASLRCSAVEVFWGVLCLMCLSEGVSCMIMCYWQPSYSISSYFHIHSFSIQTSLLLHSIGVSPFELLLRPV